jgi:N-acetylglucosamine-6-phosphate deacetylase
MRFGLIADRVHVAPEMLELALRIGADRAFLVSDGMAPMGGGPDRFTLGGREITRAGDRLTLTDGTLAGAALPLWQGVRHVAEITGWPLERAVALASDAPRDLLGLAPIRIALGHAAELLVWPETGAPHLLEPGAA